jgi:hypothetical protein
MLLWAENIGSGISGAAGPAYVNAVPLSLEFTQEQNLSSLFR